MYPARCEALASQQTRLSNTGAISFDLQVHAAGAQALAAGAAAGVRLTLANCQLDAGAKVLPRRDPAASLVGDFLSGLGEIIVGTFGYFFQNFVDVVTDVITVNIVTFCMVSLGMALLTLYRFGGRLRRKLRRRPTSPYLDSG